MNYVETEIKNVRKDINTDFRMMFSALIISVLGLASIMAKGFNWIG